MVKAFDETHTVALSLDLGALGSDAKRSELVVILSGGDLLHHHTILYHSRNECSMPPVPQGLVAPLLILQRLQLTGVGKLVSFNINCLNVDYYHKY